MSRCPRDAQLVGSGTVASHWTMGMPLGSPVWASRGAVVPSAMISQCRSPAAGSCGTLAITWIFSPGLAWVRRVRGVVPAGSAGMVSLVWAVSYTHLTLPTTF